MAEWRVRRGDSEWPVESVAMLQELARSGRVINSDYIFNPILQKWMYAQEVLELQAAITNLPSSRSTSSAPLATEGGAVVPKPQMAKKADWQQKIAIGITMIMVGIALIMISPRFVSERVVSDHPPPGFPVMYDRVQDNTNKDLAFFGGVVILIAGGVLSAVGVSESTTSKQN